MNITIVGAGAIGSLFACLLQQRQHQVQFWTRDGRSQQRLFIDNHNLQHQHYFHANQLTTLQQSDAVIICVKAFHVEDALSTIAPHLPSLVPVILCHNGIGTQSLAQAKLPHNPLLFASTSQAALKQENTITHTGLGATYIGWLNFNNHTPAVLSSGTKAENRPASETEPKITAVLRSALGNLHFEQDILGRLWEKLAINCAINPATALQGIKNGELAHPQYRSNLAKVCREVSLVATAEGYPMTANTLLANVDNVISATASNYSSMHQDIHHQRRTEIDYISGYLVERAQAHHIDVPANLQLWQAITQREQEYV